MIYDKKDYIYITKSHNHSSTRFVISKQTTNKFLPIYAWMDTTSIVLKEKKNIHNINHDLPTENGKQTSSLPRK